MIFQLSSKPLEQIILKDGMSSADAGAFCSFEGWVRNHHQGRQVTGLEYEAMETLCRAEAEKIITETRNRFETIQIKCVHRIGKLAVGEMAVWIGVTAGHRDNAFKACRYLIDEIKSRLPIWKKEFYKDGDPEWVNCQIKTPQAPSSSIKNADKY